jgi:cell division protein FtsI/penicillin-binding protein 2
MKLVTMSSAIEEGLVTPNTTYDDTGLALVNGVAIHNWDGAANGRITMTQVLIKSSNVATQWVAGLLGPDRFYRHVKTYGFGELTGIRLPGEVPGTVRTNASEGWTRVDLATNGYGQGIAVTPIQMLSAVASFANEGVTVRPHLVREIRGPDGVETNQPEPIRQVISPETAHTMIRMMTDVGRQDAYDASRVPGYDFALKTGTADTPTGNGYDLARTYASTVSLFPADNPRFAVLVRLDSPEALYGGVVAVPVLFQLGREMLTYYRIPPTTLPTTATR